MERNDEQRRGRGVYEAEHRNANDRPWVYAANRYGKQVAWLEYGPGTGRTREQAAARLWRTLDERDAEPRLTLVKPDAPERSLPQYSDDLVARAIIKVLQGDYSRR